MCVLKDTLRRFVYKTILDSRQCDLVFVHGRGDYNGRTNIKKGIIKAWQISLSVEKYSKFRRTKQRKFTVYKTVLRVPYIRLVDI